MQKLLTLLCAFFLIGSLQAQEVFQLKNPIVITGKLIKVTKPLRDFTLADKAIPDIKVRDLEGIIGKDEAFEEGTDFPLYPSSKIFTEDPALQKTMGNNSNVASETNRAIVANFNGIGYQPLNPPDPTMCAGPNHVIQMINGSSGALFKVFNKTGGQVVAQTYLDAITGKGGLGDPIALYDPLADRFILTEFANSNETGTDGLIMAVTKTNDPAGQWYVYFFSTGTTFPDYPKFGVWTDAYYGTTNNFANGSSYSGSSVYAFDKAKMIAGNASATMQKFTLGSTNKHFSMSPVSLQGTSTPPAGSGGLIAYMQDDTWTSAADIDSIGLFEFKVDFVTPANTSVTTKASLATVAYKSDICSATRSQCISQPGSSSKLEALSGKIMNQPIYRRFGAYEGIVMTHLVDKGSSIAAPRWYELRKTTGNWSIYQQSTYSLDNTNRWLPSVCYDANGNIGLAYNVSSSATGVYPGARYTGRKQCDPLNTMTYSEDVIIAGTAANGSTRYGDYNHLVCDPDGSRFWFTCEYNVSSQWSTRIASFTLDPCTATCGDPTGLAASAITNTSATVSWTAVSGAVSYDVDYKLTTSGTWINAATATGSTSVNLSGLTAGTTYDWRVRANCSSGSSNYVSSQFTTTNPAPCNAPTGLTASAITSTSATVSWSAVSGAISYTVDYKATSSGTWINAASATASTSVNLTGLAPSTSYDWRVKANCSSGSSSYSTAQFTTSAAGCTDQLEPNNTLATAAAISVGQDYKAEISYNGDNDYYAFNNTSSQPKIKVTLTGLPLNYDMSLYNPSSKLIATSANTGTTSETIIRNTNRVGTFKVYVYGPGGAFSTSQCYTLNVQLSATNFSSSAPEQSDDRAVVLRGGALKIYPVPASSAVTVTFDAYTKGSVDIIVTNQLGQQVIRKKVDVNDGINLHTLDVSNLKKGLYFVKVNNGKEVQTQKLEINR